MLKIAAKLQSNTVHLQWIQLEVQKRSQLQLIECILSVKIAMDDNGLQWIAMDCNGFVGDRELCARGHQGLVGVDCSQKMIQNSH